MFASGWLSVPLSLLNNAFRKKEKMGQVMRNNHKTKNAGYEWDVEYQIGDDPVEVMSIFGKFKIEQAITEAQNSLALNSTINPNSLKPLIVGARRTDLPPREVTDG